MNERDLALVVALERQRDELDLIIGQLRGGVAAHHAPPAEVECWADLGRAAAMLGRSDETAAKIIRQHGLGAYVHGRWRVDLTRVRAYLNGRPYDPIPPKD